MYEFVVPSTLPAGLLPVLTAIASTCSAASYRAGFSSRHPTISARHALSPVLARLNSVPVKCMAAHELRWITGSVGSTRNVQLRSPRFSAPPPNGQALGTGTPLALTRLREDPRQRAIQSGLALVQAGVVLSPFQLLHLLHEASLAGVMAHPLLICS